MTSSPDWITVGALADGFAPDAFILPNLAELEGQAFTLHFANGWQIEHRFEQERLAWHAADGHYSSQDLIVGLVGTVMRAPGKLGQRL